MGNLIKLAGRLVRGSDDCEHQPLRCKAANALKDAHYEIKRLQELRTTDGLTNWIRKYTDAEVKIKLLQGDVSILSDVCRHFMFEVVELQAKRLTSFETVVVEAERVLAAVREKQ